MLAEIRGDRTGRAWRYHPTLDRVEAAGSGERYRAKATDDDSLACLHGCEKGTYWDDEVDRLRVALSIARLPEVKAAPTIRQLIDSRDTEPGEGEFDARGTLTAIWEWADLSLDHFLQQPDQAPASVAAQVEENVGAALEVLHQLGIVHLDVAPNNILRVNGVWKLADLDSCANRGEPAVRQPMTMRYVHPDRDGVCPARDEFDFYGLREVVREMRELRL